MNRDEIELLNYLLKNGMSEMAARIYTIVLCRQYRAPLGELIQAADEFKDLARQAQRWFTRRFGSDRNSSKGEFAA